MTTVIPLTSIRKDRQVEIPRENGLESDIDVFNDGFIVELDFVLAIRDIQRIGFQIKNKSPFIKLDFEIYGAIDPGPEPPAFSTVDWSLLNNATGTVDVVNSRIFTATFPYTYITIRLKSNTVGEDTVADIVVTSSRF